MKLSEAIQEGSKKRPQAHDSFFGVVGEFDRTELSSCAIGAAMETCSPAAQQAIRRGIEAALAYLGGDALQTIPALGEPLVDCPECHHDWLYELEGEANEPGRARFLMHLVTHLNDDHRWTREHIAEWLAMRGL